LEDNKARAKGAGKGKHINFIAWKVTETADVSVFPTVVHFLLAEVIVNRIR